MIEWFYFRFTNLLPTVPSHLFGLGTVDIICSVLLVLSAFPVLIYLVWSLLGLCLETVSIHIGPWCKFKGIIWSMYLILYLVPIVKFYATEPYIMRFTELGRFLKASAKCEASGPPPPDPSARWRGGGGGVLNASHFAVGLSIIPRQNARR